MSLFENREVTDVVTAKDIRDLTGITASDYQFSDDVEDPERALDEMLEVWIRRIASHIYVRLGRSIKEDAPESLAIQDVLIRTVAKLVAVSQQQRSSPVVRINEFAINVLNTSEVTKDLDAELSPFKRKTVISVFSSAEDFKE